MFGAAFLGSAVEATEALTIVLAVGLTRGWRAPLLGTGAAIVLLAVLVLLFGELIVTRVPDWALKLLVGTLLILFGLRWLHTAVLRSAGVLPMRDEQRAYASTVSQLQNQAQPTDWVGFVLALKGVFLEGLEVVFIVIGVGGTGRNLPIAVAGGVLAALVVAAVGVVIRRPLARVPENTLKFVVGVMLSAFGVFWIGEGFGIDWPGEDIAIIAFAALFLVVALGTAALTRRVGREALQ